MSSKKILLLLILVIASCFLTACNDNRNDTSNKYKLPDLSGKSIDNYLDSIDNTLVTIVEKTEFSDTIQVNEFIRYGNDLQAGQEIEYGSIVYVYFSKGPNIPDTEGPNFLGIEDIEIEFASNYFGEFDPRDGVKVIDEVDGEIEENSWRVDGEINYYKLGEYIFKYTAWDNKGNQTIAYRTVTVVPNKLDTRYTDSLEFDLDYVGKSFREDGVGAVTLSSCTDGDTANFYDGSGTFSVRFLGIDTPESTPLGGYDPWGKAASNYTCNILQNATTIVLEGEGTLHEGYGRYIAWIWVDGRLLNLELVEQAYTKIKISADSKYYQILFDAELKTSGSQRRVWGEKDPDYDYENNKFYD